MTQNPTIQPLCTTCLRRTGCINVTNDHSGCLHYSPVSGAAQVNTQAPAENSVSDYAILGHQIGELVARKQVAYGDSFGKAGAVMRILYPDGIAPENLDDALTVVRVLDKLFRIATDRDALGESPWRDVAGYALLSVARVEGK